MQVPAGKKIYFLSDFHLGVPDLQSSHERERLIVRFLNEVQHDAFMIFIVGDMFDFWYEYRKVVPKGFVRILGKIAELTDSGIPVHFFVGNHDMWMKNYLQQELNVPVYFQKQEFVFNDQVFLIAHGDGLGPGDKGYKRLKKIFRNPVCQWLFGVLPPAIGIGLADFSSKKSRTSQNHEEEKFFGEENEWLMIYAKEESKKKKIDYFIFGHRHLPINFRLTNGSQYVNLGDWINYFTYAVFDTDHLDLISYTGKDEKIHKNL